MTLARDEGSALCASKLSKGSFLAAKVTVPHSKACRSYKTSSECECFLDYVVSDM